MANSWKSSQEEEQAFQSEGKTIVNMKMGEGKHTLRVLHAPKLFRSHWINSVQRTVICDPTCEICATGDKGKLKYAVNIIDRADKTVKIWRFGRKVKQDIEVIADDYGDPTGYDLVIIRKGLTLNDTKYTVLPARETTPLTEAEKALEKYDLDKLFAPTPKETVKSYLNGVVPEKKDSKSKSEVGVNLADDLPNLG